MWRYLRAFGYMITGRFSKAYKALMENEYVMAATYDQAIANADKNFTVTKESVAGLVDIEQKMIKAVAELEDKVKRFEKFANGAKVAMQRRIDACRGNGMTKEHIMSDPEFLKHQEAFNSANKELEEATSNHATKKAELEKRQKQLIIYKAQLQKMQRASSSLRTEKEEALADVAIAKTSEMLDSQLAGMPTEGDEDLKAAREARNRAKSRAAVAAELAGNDASVAEEQYAAYASEQASANQLDQFLNWGEDPKQDKEDLTPAKLPE